MYYCCTLFYPDGLHDNSQNDNHDYSAVSEQNIKLQHSYCTHRSMRMFVQPKHFGAEVVNKMLHSY